MVPPITLLPVCEASDTLSTLAEMLATSEISLLPVTEGDEALAQIRQLAPDLILLDESQLGLAASVDNIPLLLMTANASPEFLGQQTVKGITDFIFTPLNPALLSNRLQQQVKLIESQRQAKSHNRQTLKLRELGELIGLVSHEVASPLGNVNTAVSFLLESSERIQAKFNDQKLAANDLEKFLKQTTKALSMCIKNAANAGGIISSFRNVATNQCMDKVTQFYLHRYIDDIVLTLKSKLKKLPHEIHVVVSEGVDMTADAGAFSQLISGLISKSIKHGFDNNVPGKIIINAAVENRDGIDHIVLNFIDNGKGMTAEALDSVLDNAKPSSTDALSTAMLKRVVEVQLNGTMAVESNEEKGVHYTIVMPQHTRQ